MTPTPIPISPWADGTPFLIYIIGWRNQPWARTMLFWAQHVPYSLFWEHLDPNDTAAFWKKSSTWKTRLKRTTYSTLPWFKPPSSFKAGPEAMALGILAGWPVGTWTNPYAPRSWWSHLASQSGGTFVSCWSPFICWYAHHQCVSPAGWSLSAMAVVTRCCAEKTPAGWSSLSSDISNRLTRRIGSFP